MKETLHSRHHSTVFPRLCAIKKESPPSIADEELILHRKQRCAISQLRSGHCHLLHDYKHRVFGEPSHICTNCGAPATCHLFTFNAHQTDLTLEDLWQNPVESIREFSYLTTGTLNDLTTDLIMTNNNNKAHCVYIKI